MSAVTLQEIMETLIHSRTLSSRLLLADRIKAHGIAPPDGTVLVRKEPVAWRHWHPIELCFEYHLRPVCDRCDALYIAAAPEVKP